MTWQFGNSAAGLKRTHHSADAHATLIVGAASFAKQFFGEVSPLTSLATLIPVVPVLLSGVAAVLLALPVVVVQDLLEMAPAWLSYWLLFLAALLVFEWLTRPCRSMRKAVADMSSKSIGVDKIVA